MLKNERLKKSETIRAGSCAWFKYNFKSRSRVIRKWLERILRDGDLRLKSIVLTDAPRQHAHEVRPFSGAQEDKQGVLHEPDFEIVRTAGNREPPVLGKEGLRSPELSPHLNESDEAAQFFASAYQEAVSAPAHRSRLRPSSTDMLH